LEAFLTWFSMVAIKITYYFSTPKNRNKHMKNAQKSCFFFFIFWGWNLKLFKTKLKWSIEFFESFQLPLSDFENVACIKRYWRKTIKMVPSLSHLYFINDSIDQSDHNDHKTWDFLHTITVIYVKNRLKSEILQWFIKHFGRAFDGVNQNYILLFFSH